VSEGEDEGEGEGEGKRDTACERIVGGARALRA
jgi:hypothetical protein